MKDLKIVVYILSLICLIMIFIQILFLDPKIGFLLFVLVTLAIFIHLKVNKSSIIKKRQPKEEPWAVTIIKGYNSLENSNLDNELKTEDDIKTNCSKSLQIDNNPENIKKVTKEKFVQYQKGQSASFEINKQIEQEKILQEEQQRQIDEKNNNKNYFQFLDVVEEYNKCKSLAMTIELYSKILNLADDKNIKAEPLWEKNEIDETVKSIKERYQWRLRECIELMTGRIRMASTTEDQKYVYDMLNQISGILKKSENEFDTRTKEVACEQMRNMIKISKLEKVYAKDFYPN